jgi:hypothetical protein
MPSASAGDTTGYSIGRVVSRASVSNAADRDSPKSTHRCHSGRNASVQVISMNVANASLSQMPFHHFIVTRSPNHMWASSWAMMSTTACSSDCVAVAGSISRYRSRNVTHPRFSIAPNAKSGMATRSSLSPG